MIIKVFPDKEKARSIVSLIRNREEFISSSNIQKFPTIAMENYYEITKELITAILLLDGFKTSGENAHKELIEKLSEYNEIKEWEIVLINDLRIKRNKSSYEGKQINQSYLDNKKENLLQIIKKLKVMLNKKL